MTNCKIFMKLTLLLIYHLFATSMDAKHHHKETTHTSHVCCDPEPDGIAGVVARIPQEQHQVQVQLCTAMQSARAAILETRTQLEWFYEQVKASIDGGPERCHEWCDSLESVHEVLVSPFHYERCEMAPLVGNLGRTRQTLEDLEHTAKETSRYCATIRGFDCATTTHNLQRTLDVVHASVMLQRRRIERKSHECARKLLVDGLEQYDRVGDHWRRCTDSVCKK